MCAWTQAPQKRDQVGGASNPLLVAGVGSPMPSWLGSTRLPTLGPAELAMTSTSRRRDVQLGSRFARVVRVVRNFLANGKRHRRWLYMLVEWQSQLHLPMPISNGRNDNAAWSRANLRNVALVTITWDQRQILLRHPFLKDGVVHSNVSLLDILNFGTLSYLQDNVRFVLVPSDHLGEVTRLVSQRHAAPTDRICPQAVSQGSCSKSSVFPASRPSAATPGFIHVECEPRHLWTGGDEPFGRGRIPPTTAPEPKRWASSCVTATKTELNKRGRNSCR